jgi:hypothetical protein
LWTRSKLLAPSCYLEKRGAQAPLNFSTARLYQGTASAVPKETAGPSTREWIGKANPFAWSG